MIRHDEVVSHLRFYIECSTEEYPPYDAICTLVWESKEIIWVKGLQGTMTPALWREFALWLVHNGIKLVKLERADGHKMPFGTYNKGHYWEVEIGDRLKRWAIKG